MSCLEPRVQNSLSFRHVLLDSGGLESPCPFEIFAGDRYLKRADIGTISAQKRGTPFHHYIFMSSLEPQVPKATACPPCPILRHLSKISSTFSMPCSIAWFRSHAYGLHVFFGSSGPKSRTIMAIFVSRVTKILYLFRHALRNTYLKSGNLSAMFCLKARSKIKERLQHARLEGL